jgi:hypothetical protein
VKLQIATMSVLVIAVLVFAGGVVALLGLDGQMVIGVAAGMIAGAGLTLLGGRGLSRALRHTKKGALIVHIYGGFLLRLMLLVAGFLALASSGVANPVGFAVAFLAGTVVALFRQVMVFGSKVGNDGSGLALTPNPKAPTPGILVLLASGSAFKPILHRNDR